MTRLAFLWHMHQPMYVSADTGEAILPWVRFHATHAYYDMARMLERHPNIRCTVNFVPCLVEQLEGAAAGTMRERYLELSRRRPEEMSAEDRRFIVRQFFMVNRDRCVRPVPRYLELFQKRGADAERIDASRFDDGDLRDLQVHFNLAWMGFAARSEEAGLKRLLQKGGGFSEEDKAELLAIQQKVVQNVLPLWRKLTSSGQIEISSTPYFHPILPLLCDSDAARRAMPDAALPPRFMHPEDARRQVRMAIEKHRAVFGQPPTGMWPAEGSVSPEALTIFASEGVRWLATDEGNLFRSAPAPEKRGSIFQAWSCATPDGPIALAFRDHTLSDRIGFTYAKMKAEAAVADFLTQVDGAVSDARAVGIADPVVPVILDGENAWEHFEDKGEGFLHQLYSALEARSGLRTVTMNEALAKPTGHLTRIHSGSWIDSNYRIWIGHPEDNLGWELLGRVRELFGRHEQSGDVAPEVLEAARRHLLSAEGSDWFWWYGDDFETDNAAEFDLLFRDRLIRAATLLGETPPARLHEPISTQASRQRASLQVEPPAGFIRPVLDGRAESFVRWLGAGTFRPTGAQGAMYQSARVVAQLRFGCDAERFSLRVEPTAPLSGKQLKVTLGAVGREGKIWTIGLDTRHAHVSPKNAQVAFGHVVELSLPLEGLGIQPGDTLQFHLQVLAGEVELERVPAFGALLLEAHPSGRRWMA